MTKPKLISVIVPAYNNEAFITEALESILAQRYEPLEVIVIDDGSIDNTAIAIQKFGPPVQYHYQANSGTSVARNRGIALAKGEWLAFLDADDVWTANKLQQQSVVLRDDPIVDLVLGRVQEFSDAIPKVPDLKASVPGHHPGAMLIRRAVFDKVGLFSTQFQGSEVVEWITRVTHAQLRQVMLAEVFMYRRLHADNKGRSGRYSRHEYLHVLKRHLDRQRSKP